jgi:hypothetical protein
VPVNALGLILAIEAPPANPARDPLDEPLMELFVEDIDEGDPGFANTTSPDPFVEDTDEGDPGFAKTTSPDPFEIVTDKTLPVPGVKSPPLGSPSTIKAACVFSMTRDSALAAAILPPQLFMYNIGNA